MLHTLPAGQPDFDHTRLLWPEILLYIFDFLPQKGLLSASGACHRWRTLVLSHPNMYFSIALHVDVERANFGQQLHAFCLDLEHVCTQAYRASLLVDWSPVGGPVVKDGKLSFPADVPDAKEKDPARDRRVLATSKIMAAVQKSLPYLIKLELRFAPVLRQTLEECVFPFLNRAAPRLQEFSAFMRLLPHFTLHLCEFIESSLPCDLFASNAPNLRTISIDGVLLPDEGVHAFRNARCVSLESLPEVLRVDKQFPHIKELQLRTLPTMRVDKVDTLPSTLDLLRIGFTHEVQQVLSNARCLASLAKFPHTIFQVIVDGIDPNSVSFAPFFQNHPRELHVVLQLCNNRQTVAISVMAPGSLFERGFALLGPTSHGVRTIFAHTLRPLAPFIAQLQVDQELFEVLSDVFDALPVMTNLNVNWSPYHKELPVPDFEFSPPIGGWRRVHCPKLEQLNLIDGTNCGQISAERLRNILKPELSVLQVYVGVQRVGHLVQMPVGGDFVAVESDEGYVTTVCSKDKYSDNMFGVMYHVDAVDGVEA